MTSPKTKPIDVSKLDIPLERDIFLRNLLRELSGTLQDVVGLEEASGFISVVGQSIGRQLNHEYRTALGTTKLDRNQVEAVLVDLKDRIQGDFFVLESDDKKIVLGNRACPFGDKVQDRQSLCMMTSNVFGSITADNLGYARVVLDKTIASGAPGCQVTIYLNPSPGSKSEEGREYFQSVYEEE